LEEKQKQKKEKDRQLQAGLDMLKRARDRLSEVKTNKEYQSLLKEIETSEEKNSALEDEIIYLLDSLDGLENENKLKAGELDNLRHDYEGEKQKITREIGSLDEELNNCLCKIEELKQEMPADVIKKYEKIKTIGHGLAVVPVWKEVCYGCHMAIPPQMYNELQTSDEIMTCPNCNRIIYWEDRRG
jgi:predicted  nucleic acid-binding Zn-ribbon protein